MRRKVAAAIITGAVVAAGAVTWVVTDSHHTPTAAPTPTAPAMSTCGLTGTPGTPTNLPATWQNVAGWSLPISPTDGPGIRNPTASWSCYAHTPAGAVLAGAVIPMRADGVAEDWQTVVREQTVPGAGQTAKLNSTPTATSDIATIRGFTIAAYSEDRATINYYLPTASGQFSCTVDVVWYNSDWRLRLGDDGSTATGCTPGVPASFTPWGP